MCGIVGVITKNNKADGFINEMSNALEVLKQRGPDHTGTYLHENVLLGHTRLSVIDVSENASQPFTDSSGRYTIVYNGEIFNFKELRNQLIEKGFLFRSQSDTEVLLNLFICFGADCLNMLNGFFAFAIYDKIEKSLFIARDRMGVKPLLIFRDDEKMIFASEMKALLCFQISKELDESSLFQYLQLNYISAPHSIFKKVKKIKAGFYIFIKGNFYEEKEYYKIPFQNQLKNFDSYEIALKKTHELLENAVQRRMVSDVPLGAFLSGGIDSSVIVGLASKFTKQLKTFSIGFSDEPLFDETSYAQLVADKYKTDHTVFKLKNDDLFGILQNVLDYTDEPFADSSALAVYILSMHAKKHVTVALSGDGADEILGGYNKHMAEWKVQRLGKAGHLLKYFSPFLDVLPQSRNTFLGNKIRQLNRYTQGMGLSEAERYWLWCSIADEMKAATILKLNIDNDEYINRKSEIIDFIDESGDFNKILYADSKLVLQNDMLVKVDMMSMANSLEIRSPFLDYEFVNYMFSLPAEYKITSNIRKKILKDAFRNELPEKIFHRGKQGFEVPLLKWFRTDLRSMITDDLLNKDFVEHQNIFDVHEMELLKKQLFSSNPGDAAARIWGLIVFQYWWKKNINL